MSGAKEDRVVVVVTGASRGLGLQLVKDFLASKRYRVVATCRSPSSAHDLQEQQKGSEGALSVVALDVESEASIKKAAEEIAGLVDRVDLLVNNAGINADDITEKLGTVDLGQLERIFRTNVAGPLVVTRTLEPLLLKATLAEGPRVVNISSLLGSIGSTTAEGSTLYPSYRVSKAGLNMLTRLQSIEWANDKKTTGIVIALHPGWVATDMGKRAGSPPLTPEQSSAGMIKVIEALKKSDNGRLLVFDGSELPW